MTGDRKDRWFTRRIMKLTRFEKSAVNSPSHAQRTRKIGLELVEHIELPPRPHCLEIGCGQGALARLLVERLDAQVIATDFDPDQVSLARERLSDLAERVTLQAVDARHLPFEDARFDAVFSFGVMHHIPRGWRQVVAEVARVLKPDGFFIFTDIFLAPALRCAARILFPRLDQLEKGALHECLADCALELKYSAEERDMFGLLRYEKAIAHKEPNA